MTTLLGDEVVAPAAPPKGRRRGWPALLPISLDLLRTKLPAPPVPPRAYGQSGS